MAENKTKATRASVSNFIAAIADETKRADDGRWSPGIIEALRALKLERAKVGVGRLHGVPRNLEGDVNATTLQRIREALPQAAFDSAADLLMRVKLARSAEEILSLLESLNRDFQKTIVMVTHDPRAAERAHTRRHLEKGVLKA